MFKQMHVHVTDSDAEQIFNSIDIDQNRSIQWSEFKLDFDKCVSMSVDELEAEERTLHPDDDGMMGGYGATNPGMKYDANEAIGNAMKFND